MTKSPEEKEAAKAAKLVEKEAAKAALADVVDSKEDKPEVVVPKVKSDLEVRFKAFLEKYKEQNPEKFAIKEAKGEFNKIPDSFV